MKSDLCFGWRDSNFEVWFDRSIYHAVSVEEFDYVFSVQKLKILASSVLYKPI